MHAGLRIVNRNALACVKERTTCRESLYPKAVSARRVQNCEYSTVAKLDATKLHCSCQTKSDVKSENSPRAEAKIDNQFEKTVALSTVNVKPWENDVVKSTSMVEPTRSQDAERERRIDKNIARLMSLIQESNERRHNEFGKHGNETQACQEDGDTTQYDSKHKTRKDSVF